MIFVERETEGSAAGCPRQDCVVSVAAREHVLLKLPKAPGRIPVAARVEVCPLKQEVELCLVLDRALQPAEFVLQIPGGVRNEHLRDLMYTEPEVSGMA